MKRDTPKSSTFQRGFAPPSMRKQVLRLDVAVDDSGRLRARQRFADLTDELDDLIEVEGALLAQEVREIGAGEPLEHEVGAAVRERAGREDFRHVLGADGVGDLHFALEARELARAVEQVRVQNLECDALASGTARRGVDLAHRAAPDDVAHAQIAQRLTAQAAEPARVEHARELVVRFRQQRAASFGLEPRSGELGDRTHRRLARAAREPEAQGEHELGEQRETEQRAMILLGEAEDRIAERQHSEKREQ
jgi:hypothetical protein